MLEATLWSVLGWLALAAASYRFRREAGVDGAGRARAFRVLGAALLVLAWLGAGGDVTGERVVRFLGGASIAGVAVVLALSWNAAVVLAPFGRVLRRSR